MSCRKRTWISIWRPLALNEVHGTTFLAGAVADDNALAFLRQDSFLNLRLAYGL